MFATIITLFFILALLALVWWGVGAMGVPEPIKTIVLIFVALVALFYLYHLFLGGGTSVLLHSP
jgi:hypothetical protein